MELSNRIYWLFFIAFVISISTTRVAGQTSYAPVLSAKYNGKYLKLIFINCSNEIALVPNLEKRRSDKNNFLHEEYWSIQEDTLALHITREVSTALYDIINREGGTTTGQLFYTDFEIEPGTKRREKTSMNLPENIKYIKVGGLIMLICR